ncbi:metallophosphoesterase family protein [Rubricoccus marinus]|uniref:YfcE family phosphodiesterase n=1 Tax=Rubricoccus marinus TaxID=716817 RepID=A0A259U0T9_9BACT|nr:metallophosphoesterase family protein [Rubricoccus marinus]OZC03560.1 YfcE family phosphodiesterase [Rubricoccus marinus]
MTTTFAVFSDVHANLPALEAVLRDIDARLGRGEVDAVYCLGDLVGYATWPNEVVTAVQERGIATIAGNYDEGVGLGSDDCGCAYLTDEDKARGAESIAYTNGAVTDATRRYLRSLPRHLRVTLAPPRERKAEPIEVLMVHGSPRRINEYLFEDRPDDLILKRMTEARADVMLVGHTHKPYHKALAVETETGETLYRHAVNIGSVGKPKDGDPRSCYVLLTVDSERPKTDPGYCSAEFIRVEYDVEETAQAIEASPLPNDFAQMLRDA